MKYTKVIIKSKDDLPKEDKWYIGFSRVINDFIHFNPISSNCKDIDWYLIEDTEKSYPEEFVENINRTIITQLEQKVIGLMDAEKEREKQLEKFAESLYEVVKTQAEPINKKINPMRYEGFESGGKYVISLLKDYLYNKTIG